MRHARKNPFSNQKAKYLEFTRCSWDLNQVLGFGIKRKIVLQKRKEKGGFPSKTLGKFVWHIWHNIHMEHTEVIQIVGGKLQFLPFYEYSALSR